MTGAAWDELRRELDRWADCGDVATLWWRDDDAVRWTPQLATLLSVANGHPLCLAVIPAQAEPQLSTDLRPHPGVAVLQHGWRHLNHHPHPLDGKSEYPPERPLAVVSAEIAAGRRLLDGYFGATLLPVFVPPFHGFAPQFVPLLAEHGLIWLSRAGPPQLRAEDIAVREVNIQTGLFDFGRQCFGDDEIYLSRLLDHLAARRTGRVDRAQATGILTHHLVQDALSYAFVDKLLDLTDAHPAARWLAGPELFALPPGGGGSHE